jgi:RNA polymerase sigma-70 factor (ECF subfamily)
MHDDRGIGRKYCGKTRRMTDKRLTSFEAQRGHLLGIAYRMLGEMAGAEDVVQEAWLRWQRVAESDIRDPRAWLSAATVRLALDSLRKARARRETYVGPWLPEPLLPDDIRVMTADATAAQAELASDLSLALLHVLERLSPEERAALIMHDAFDCDYPAIAAMLDKNEAACRKLVSRARDRVRAERPRFTVSKERHAVLVARFAEASLANDPAKLAALFADDIVFYSDGGGRVPAALNPVYGADRVSRLIVGLMRKLMTAQSNFQMTDVNGQASVAIAIGEQLHSVTNIESDGDKITAIFVVRNPEKLTRVGRGIAAGQT